MKVLVKNLKSKQMNQSKGFALSILIHTIAIAAVISAASNIRPVQKTMVIDFNILENPIKKESFKQTVKKSLPFHPAVKPFKKKYTPILPKPPLKKKITTIKPKPIPLIKSEPIPKLVPKLEVELKADLEPELIAEQIISIKPKNKSEILNFPARNQRETQLVAQNMSANTASAMLTSNLPFGLSAPVALEPRPDGYQTSVSQYTKAQFSHIQKSIQQLIKFPRIARKMGWEGKVVVEFIICKDGTVKDILTVQSSGFKALDKNAVESIKKAAPFPKPPTTAKLIIPVVYQLNTG